MQYGVATFKEGMAGIIKFTNATSIKSFANIFLKKKLREDGKEVTKGGLKKYLEEWFEQHNENCEDGDKLKEVIQIVSEAASNMVYSASHLQKKANGSYTWEPLTSEEKKEFCRAIEEVMEGVL